MADEPFFTHEQGTYLTVSHPTEDPGNEGLTWKAIIRAEDCFLPDRDKESPMGRLVPTKEEWEKIAEAILQERLNMRMFCRLVQKSISYKENNTIYDAQIWVGEDLTERDLRQMILCLRTIYATETDVEKERKANELYRRVARFVKAMVIATSKANIPPYILHGWRKPEGVASDVWWEHQGWLQAVHADSLVRIRLFHPDHFDKVSWDKEEMDMAARGAVNERTFISAHKKHVSENRERIMIELENHDRRVRGQEPRQPREERQRPQPSRPTERCTPWEDVHFIKGEFADFQILFLTGSTCGRGSIHIYTTDQLNRE
eukprot:5966816-Amphidinium_carterae.1